MYYNQTPEHAAVGVMVSAGFQPNVPYTNNRTPWSGVCLKCGQPGTPRLGMVKRGIGACAYCSKKKVDKAVAVGKMLAVDFEPMVPYKNNKTPWLGVCLKCGSPGSPKFTHIANGEGACGNCPANGISLGERTTLYVVANSELIKMGLSNSPRRRLGEHAKQGLTDVLFQVEEPDGYHLKEIESEWKAYIKSLPEYLRCSKASIPDGWTETALRTPEAEEWIMNRLGASALVGAQ